MATSDQACRRAVMASQEVILENCADLKGSVEEIGDDIFAFVPDHAKDEFDFDLNSPQTQEEIEQAIESCMNSTYARQWADAVVGDDAPRDAQERARRRVCEGLFS